MQKSRQRDLKDAAKIAIITLSIILSDAIDTEVITGLTEKISISLETLNQSRTCSLGVLLFIYTGCIVIEIITAKNRQHHQDELVTILSRRNFKFIDCCLLTYISLNICGRAVELAIFGAANYIEPVTTVFQSPNVLLAWVTTLEGVFCGLCVYYGRNLMLRSSQDSE